MDYEQAHSIFLSKGIVEVKYEGKPVWIKTLNQRNDTAEIALVNDDSHSNIVVKIKDLY